MRSDKRPTAIGRRRSAARTGCLRFRSFFVFFLFLLGVFAGLAQPVFADAVKIAVMPFVNKTDKPQNDWYGTGIAEAVSFKLRYLPDLYLIERINIDEALRANDASQSNVFDDKKALYVQSLIGPVHLAVGEFDIVKKNIVLAIRLFSPSGNDPPAETVFNGKLKNLFQLNCDATIWILQNIGRPPRPDDRLLLPQRLTDNVNLLENYSLMTNFLFGIMTVRDASSAISIGDVVLNIDPSFAEGLNRMGNAFENLNKMYFKEAEKTYRKAILFRPDFAEAYYNLGLLLAKSGRLREALDPLRSALEKKPGYEEAQKALDKYRKKYNALYRGAKGR